MGSVILFKGSTIYQSGVNGAEFTFRPGSLGEEVVEIPPRVGNGSFTKKRGKRAARHQLVLKMTGTSKATIREALDALRGETGTLIVPGEGVMTKCTVMDVTYQDSFKSSAEVGYVMGATLEILQNP